MQNRTQFIATLQQLSQFASLSDETQQALVTCASYVSYDAGQVIYLEGEPAEWVFILESGWIKATRMTLDGREQAMMFLQPVEVFGDIAVFAGSTYPGTVIALEPVCAWKIPAEKIISLIPTHPDLAMAVIRHLAERVIHYVNLVEDLALRTVESRLAHTLLQNAVLEEGILVVRRREWATFDQMAVRIGTVRDVLRRALKTLETEQLIRVEKRAILLLNPKGLAARAHR